VHRSAPVLAQISKKVDAEGPRELQRKVAPEATHILDWFHVAMHFAHLLNLVQGQPPPESCAPVDMRAWSLDLIRRAKGALWHGQTWKTQAYLEDLCGWCHARRQETPRVLAQLAKSASELLGYLDAKPSTHNGPRDTGNTNPKIPLTLPEPSFGRAMGYSGWLSGRRAPQGRWPPAAGV
jgi:hypothetical protein